LNFRVLRVLRVLRGEIVIPQPVISRRDERI